MARLKDVAERAGVSVATVSYVVNGSRKVSPGLRSKVEKAIKELGYNTNLMARGLKMGKTMNIGVIMPEVSAIYFPEVLNGIEDEARNLGYNILYFSSKRSIEQEKKYIEMLRSNWVDGIILDSYCRVEDELKYAEFLGDLSRGNVPIPVVSLERKFDTSKVNSILIDREYYCYEMAKYVLSKGNKDIIYLSGPLNLSMFVESLKGFKRAYAETGDEFDESYLYETDYSTKQGYQTILSCLKRGVKFSTVYANNDQLAIGALKAIKENGLRVPEDVIVVGFDDVFPSTLVSPSLTTVHVPKRDIGTNAIKLLVRHIENKTLPCEKIQLDCEIMYRRSSEPDGNNEWSVEW